jgi:uncharacterized protein (DUF488 family)
MQRRFGSIASFCDWEFCDFGRMRTRPKMKLKRQSTSSNAKVGATRRKTKRRTKSSDLLVLTIGHSTRPIEEFTALLLAHSVTKLIDVRTVPRSKRNPQFNRDTLPASLEKVGIGYEHSPALGGLRRTHEGSPNKGWRNSSFRGYADHMQTAEFRNAVEELIRQTKEGERLALMCAEAVPWRCHRSLIADALLVRDVKCEDIRTKTQRMPHRLTRFARVYGTDIIYPAEEARSGAAL